MVLYSVYLVSLLANLAEMTAFEAIVALSTTNWALFVACVWLAAARIAKFVVSLFTVGSVVSLTSLFSLNIPSGSV